MKKLSKLLLLSTFMVIVFWSCKKDENQVFLEGGTAPTLSASVAGSVPLAFATKDNEAIKLSWTNPDYKFNTGISSQDVAYEIQIDTTGSNFTNPKKKSLSISKELNYSFKQTELNDYILNALELKEDMPHNLEFRVKASLINSSAALFSNVLKLKTTPYSIPPKVEVPANGTLWITGSAVASSWSNPIPSAPVDYESKQRFTKVSPTKYELTVDMISGGGFKLIQVQGDWNSQYSKKSGDALSGEFEKKDATQFDAPAVSGKYKITADFKTGKYTLVKQ